jgi:hypothetical protein
MTKVVGIFDTEAKMDDVLETIFEHDVDGDDISILRNAGAYGDSSVERSDAADMPVFPVAGQTTRNGISYAGSGAGAVAFEVSSNEIDLEDETMAFYMRKADDGATILFIDADDYDTEVLRSTMEEHNASRVDVLD